MLYCIIVNRMKYDYDLLVKYCEENNIILSKDYSNDKINRESIIEGKCILCDEIFIKKFRQFHKTNGYCVFHTKENKINNHKKTFIEKYGVENALQIKEIKEKIKNTCLKKYGVEHPFQNEEITPLHI